MKIAHLADLHLGFRRYDAFTPGGMNRREADVQDAVRRAVDDLLVVRPDVVLLAGDIFHTPRPSNAAILFLFQQLHRLRQALPDAPIVAVAGDHDTSRSKETGENILSLYRALRVDVAIGTEAHRFQYAGLTIAAVPKWACAKIPLPETGVTNLLVAHGEARKVGKLAPEIDVEKFAGYDYVALGHWHVCQRIAPNAWYAGAIEYTSTDPWSEVRIEHEEGLPGKGYLMTELGSAPVLRPIATRLHLDLPPLEGLGLTALDLNHNIAEALKAQPIAGAVVRLKVLNVNRETKRAIDWKALREFKAQALHLQVEIQPTEEEAPTVENRARLRQSLDEEVESFFRAYAISPETARDVGIEEFARTALAYVRGEDPYTGEKVGP